MAYPSGCGFSAPHLPGFAQLAGQDYDSAKRPGGVLMQEDRCDRVHPTGLGYKYRAGSN